MNEEERPRYGIFLCCGGESLLVLFDWDNLLGDRITLFVQQVSSNKRATRENQTNNPETGITEKFLVHLLAFNGSGRSGQEGTALCEHCGGHCPQWLLLSENLIPRARHANLYRCSM